MRHLWHLPIRNLLTRKARSLLTTLGVVFGVAMVVGIAVTYDSAEAHVKHWIGYWHGRAHIRVRPSAGDTLPSGLLERIRRIRGVRLAAPHYSTWVRARHGKRRRPTLLMAVDPRADGKVGGFVAGHEPAVAEALAQGARPLLLRARHAERLRVRVGGEVVLSVPGKSVPFRVVGILSRERFPATTPSECGVTGIDAARELLADLPPLTAIDVLLSDGADSDTVVEQISAGLGSAVVAEQRDTRADAFHQNIRIVKLTARIISATTLFVGVFIIFNTMAMTVVERKREMGMLRAIGAGKRQIGAIIMCEAAVMGVVGSLLGVLLGLGMARLAATYVGRGLPSLVIRSTVLLTGAAMGLGATLIAAAVPAVMASRVSPLEATRPFRRGDGAARVLRRLWLGIGLMVGMTLLLYAPIPSWIKVPILTSVGIFCFYLGAALIAPFLVAPLAGALMPVLGPLLRGALCLVRFPMAVGRSVWTAASSGSARRTAEMLRSIGPTTKESLNTVSTELARGNLARSSGRTALTACALMVGVSFVVDLSGDAGSVVHEFHKTLDAFSGADLFVLPKTPAAPSLDPEVFRKIDGVAAVTGMKLFLAEAPDHPVKHSVFFSGKMMFVGIEPETFAEIMWLQFNRGDFRSGIEELKKGGAVWISSDLVRLGGPGMGGELKLRGTAGDVSFRVAGEIRDPRLAVYTDWRDWTDIKGIVGSFVAIGSIDDARRHFGGSGFDFALIKLKDGIDRKAVVKKVRGAAWWSGCKAQQIGLRNERMLEDAREAVNSINTVLFVAILIAALAVLNTMTMNVVERTREIGVLRALGATRGQILEVFLAEAAVIGVIGAVLGVGLGLLLMHASLTLNYQVMGWKTDFVIPFREIGTSSAACILVAFLGGLYPAIRAARIKIVDAIQME